MVHNEEIIVKKKQTLKNLHLLQAHTCYNTILKEGESLFMRFLHETVHVLDFTDLYTKRLKKKANFLCKKFFFFTFFNRMIQEWQLGGG